jgi:predicted SprT family Zn-dependent metalloprotease
MIKTTDPKMAVYLKDLTKEMYFAENRLTTLEEMKALALALLATTWKINIFRFQPESVINLMDKGWTFEFNTRKRAAGLCNYRYKKIYLSEWLLKQNLDKSLEFENTLRHEIAHALDFEMGGRNKHNHIWKAIAKKVLCTAERCYSSDVIQTKVETKYTLVCNTCEKESPRHKKPKREVACGACCNEYNRGKYSDKYKLRVVQNY